MTDPNQPPPLLPELPVDLSDPTAIDSWYTAWNQWIADEASKRGWSWLKPMTPAMLHEVVEQEKQRRAAVGAQESYNNDLIAARSALEEVESRLRASDPSYKAKRRILLPVLAPLLKAVPPAKWRELFDVAYSQFSLYESQTAEAYQREVELARAAIRNLESQHKENDPDFEEKNALLRTILAPAMRNMHASRWVYAYQQAYANINLPQRSPSAYRTAPPDIALIDSDGVRRIFADEDKAKEYLSNLPSPNQDRVVFVGGPTTCWMNVTGLSGLVSAVGAPHNNFPKIKTRIDYEFRRAGYEMWRSALHQVFFDMRSKVEAEISPTSTLGAEWESQYRKWILGECWIRGTPNFLDGHIDFEALRRVVRREIESKRMKPDHYLCNWVREYFASEYGDYDLLPHNMKRVKRFTASILRGEQSELERRWRATDEEDQQKKAIYDARQRLKESVDGGDIIAFHKKKQRTYDRYAFVVVGCFLALYALIAVVVSEVAATFFSIRYSWWKVLSAMIVTLLGAYLIDKAVESAVAAITWRLGRRKLRFKELLEWMISNDMPTRSEALSYFEETQRGWGAPP